MVTARRRSIAVLLLVCMSWSMVGTLAVSAFAQGLASPAALTQARPRLGVLGVYTTRSSTYAEYVRNLITHDVTTLDRFDVVERGNIDAVLREQRFQLSGAIDPDTAVAVGRILGIDIGVIGSLEVLEARRIESFYRAEAVTMVRLIDMQTGRLIATLRVEGSGNGDTIQEAQRRALEHGFGGRFRNRLASVFSFQGSVIEVHGDGDRGETVFLSLGRNQGVQVGAEFLVQRPEVTTLAGVELDASDYFLRTVATVRVTDTSADFSRATVVRSSERIMEGDTVVEVVPARSSEERAETLMYVLGALLLVLLLSREGVWNQ